MHLKNLKNVCISTVCIIGPLKAFIWAFWKVKVFCQRHGGSKSSLKNFLMPMNLNMLLEAISGFSTARGYRVKFALMSGNFVRWQWQGTGKMRMRWHQQNRATRHRRIYKSFVGSDNSATVKIFWGWIGVNWGGLGHGSTFAASSSGSGCSANPVDDLFALLPSFSIN